MPWKEAARVSRLDLAHDVIDGGWVGVSGLMFCTRVARVCDHALPSMFGQSTTNNIHQIRLLFRREQFDCIKRFIEFRISWHKSTPKTILATTSRNITANEPSRYRSACKRVPLRRSIR